MRISKSLLIALSNCNKIYGGEEMLLSICIPTWNRNIDLGRLVYSIVSQMTEELCEKVELCISDNFSDVDPLPMIEEIAEIQPMFKIVYNRNTENIEGMPNMRKVISMAKGEYCWLFGNDDCMYPGAIGEVVTRIEQNPGVDLITATFDSLNSDTKSVTRIFHTRSRQDELYKVNNEEEFRRYFIEVAEYVGGNQGLFCFYSSVIFRKENWDKYYMKECDKKDSFFIQSWIHMSTFREGGSHLAIAKPLLVRECRDDWERVMNPVLFYSIVTHMYELLFGMFDEELAWAIAQSQIPTAEVVVKNFMDSEIEDEKKEEVLRILQRVSKR